MQFVLQYFCMYFASGELLIEYKHFLPTNWVAFGFDIWEMLKKTFWLWKFHDTKHFHPKRKLITSCSCECPHQGRILIVTKSIPVFDVGWRKMDIDTFYQKRKVQAASQKKSGNETNAWDR